jgi:predicted nucleic acid-binding protein
VVLDTSALLAILFGEPERRAKLFGNSAQAGMRPA